MNLLSQTTAPELVRITTEATQGFSGADCFEQAAQELVRKLQAAYPKSIVMARAYLTVPMQALPPSNSAWVRSLAKAKGIEAELSDNTRVISLVGSAGRRPAWNDRRASQGHVGIPMTSASFIDAIPMMSRLMASLGGNLQWIDNRDLGPMLSRLGTVAGTFYVAEAAHDTDAAGRKIISASDFVTEHGVRTVFGLGGAFASGELLVLLVFCDEPVPRTVVDLFQGPFLRFKTASAPLLRKVFVDGGSSRAESEAQPPLCQNTGHADARDASETAEERLATKQRELEALNALYLELESQLENRTRSLKLILDSTGDGMLLADFDQRITGETTAAVTRWFDAPKPGTRAGDLLFGAATSEALAFSNAFAQLVEDVLPFELAASQMPDQLTRGAATLKLTYRQVFEKGQFARVLIVIQDITATLAAEQAQAQARELHAMVGNILRDRADYRRFVSEAAALIDAIATAHDPRAQLRDLHTLKGSTAVYGLSTFPALVHEIESDLTDRAGMLGAAQIEALRQSFGAAISMVEDFLGTDDDARVQIRLAEHDDFLRRLGAGETGSRLTRIARSWRDEPTISILRKLGAQATRLGKRLGKPIEVLIEDSGARVPLDVTQWYWAALIHAIRNAVDHGIESADSREAAGKPQLGRLRLACDTAQDSLQVTIADDGQGIDWDAVRAKARDLGLPHETRHDLSLAIFSDGVTTRAQLSETSGRGVGLSALREACRALGGDVNIESVPHVGTTLRARVPLSSIFRPSMLPIS